MVKCFLKKKLKEIQLYKLHYIAKRWKIARFSSKRKPALVNLIFNHSKNKNKQQYFINLSEMKKPKSLTDNESNKNAARQEKKN